LAEMFDTKEYLPALGTVRRVEIGFAGSGFPPPPAWLLAGWLASRLSWAPAGASSKGLVFRSGSGDVLVAMTGDRRGEGRALERIRIQAEELIAAVAGATPERPRRILLSGVTTPEPLYRILASEPTRSRIDWNSIECYFGDERPVPQDHPESNSGLAFRTLLEPLGLQAPR